MFKAVLTNIKRSGKRSVEHKEIINEEDTSNLYSSHILNKNTAQGLQYKVFLDVMFIRVKEEKKKRKKRKMRATDFVLKIDGLRRCKFQNLVQYETKNHRISETNDEDVQSARIYEIPSK